MGRRSERFETRDLDGVLPPAVRGNVLDISVDGLAVETGQPLKPDREYVIRLGEGPESLTLKGTVRWSHLQGTRRDEDGDLVAYYDSGMAFGDDLAGVPFHILPLIEKHAALKVSEAATGILRIDEVPVPVEFELRKVATRYLVAKSPLPVEEGARGRVTLQLRGEELTTSAEVREVRDLTRDEEELRYSLDLRLLEPPDAVRSFVRTELAERLWPGRSKMEPRPDPASAETPSEPSSKAPAVAVRGNERSEIFHGPACRHFESSPVEFSSREEAIRRGYRPAKDCDP